eukprot:4980831-Pyramimonas_sp.AAC.1
MYDSSMRFGYCLKRAQQIQQLDRSLSVYTPASSTLEGGPLQTRTTELAHFPLQAYLYSQGKKPSTMKLGSPAARRVCKLQTDGLFGAYETHSKQMQRELQASTSVVDPPSLRLPLTLHAPPKVKTSQTLLDVQNAHLSKPCTFPQESRPLKHYPMHTAHTSQNHARSSRSQDLSNATRCTQRTPLKTVHVPPGVKTSRTLADVHSAHLSKPCTFPQESRPLKH